MSMHYRNLGSLETPASIIGLGTWVIGGGSAWGADPDDTESIRAIHAALDTGINLIDTAPAYGWGRSEQVIGKAIRGRRDKVVIATKCGLWWDDERGSFFFIFDGRPMRRSLRPDTIQIEIERSLERLGTDYIDLYQTHWPAAPPEATPVADTMATLMKLKQQGKIRAIGVSNVTLDELKENCSQGEVTSLQLRYSMLFREPEKEILPYCQAHNIATLTYMSLEHGLLSGKVGMDRTFAKDEFRSNDTWNPWFLLPNRRRILDLLARWKDLTHQHGCTLAQLVLAWTAAQPGITHVLCGARSIAQVKENTRAGELSLDAATLQRMRHDVEALGEPVRDAAPSAST